MILNKCYHYYYIIFNIFADSTGQKCSLLNLNKIQLLLVYLVWENQKHSVLIRKDNEFVGHYTSYIFREIKIQLFTLSVHACFVLYTHYIYYIYISSTHGSGCHPSQKPRQPRSEELPWFLPIYTTATVPIFGHVFFLLFLGGYWSQIVSMAFSGP